MPGSAFLRRLNALPRRAGVRYHILAGDVGFLAFFDYNGNRRIDDEDYRLFLRRLKRLS